MWDGSASQVDAHFRLGKGSTYPLLLKGSSSGHLYGFDRHNYAVIDHNGILRYRSDPDAKQRFDEEAIRTSITLALKALQTTPPTIPEENADIQEDTDSDDLETQDEEDEMITAAPVGSTPNLFSLEPNFPNPFNAVTNIRFNLPQASPVELRIYNLTGHLVHSERSARLLAGTHILQWDGRGLSGISLASGVYFYRLSTTTDETSRKMMFLQ